MCFPGLPLLARETDQSIRTVQRRLLELEELKLIIRKRRCRSDGRGKGRDKDLYFLTIGPSGQPDALVHEWSKAGRPTRQPVPTNVTLLSRPIDEPTRTLSTKQQPSTWLGSKPAKAELRKHYAEQKRHVASYLALALDVGEGDQDSGVALLDALPLSELDHLIARQQRGTLNSETIQNIRNRLSAAPVICPA